ncbi:hypothetical protein ACFQ48_12950 [Hymenobacter caeli]|uniref:Lipoprotein n=1 Tax=Hymenobacter caeli TaxID=2735894 RepID=A0ABX2FTU3_9BACT|nr:hypothetical protein [Hymenobacter caeli]NRT20253.1 hypothetical protein [Hymenobacter caeli]
MKTDDLPEYSAMRYDWLVPVCLVLALLASCGGSSAGGGPGGPPAGSTAGGKPVGVFFFMDVFNNQHVYCFTPAGQVYVDPADFSAAALAALPPGQRGTCAVSGPTMTIKWADGSTKTGNYRADPTGFGCEGSFMCVAPLAGARQLAGAFEGRNAAVRVDANSLAVYRTLHFLPDGTFTRDSYAAAHLNTDPTDRADLATDAASAAPRQAGRWKLDGWYLTLTDAQGTVRAPAFRTDWDEKTDQTKGFCFNGTSYKSTGAQ